ncbi:MAG: zinc-ribbon domain-containing protein [Ardenticatenaceae bacterium]
MLTYRDCGSTFLFTEGEQEFFAAKGLTSPVRCRDCRATRKRQHSSYDDGSNYRTSERSASAGEG